MGAVKSTPFQRQDFDAATDGFCFDHDDWSVQQLLVHVQTSVPRPSCCTSVAAVYKTTAVNALTKRGAFKRQLILLGQIRRRLCLAQETIAEVRDERIDQTEKKGLKCRFEKQDEALKDNKLEDDALSQTIAVLDARIAGNTTETLRLAFAFLNEVLQRR